MTRQEELQIVKDKVKEVLRNSQYIDTQLGRLVPLLPDKKALNKMAGEVAVDILRLDSKDLGAAIKRKVLEAMHRAQGSKIVIPLGKE